MDDILKQYIARYEASTRDVNSRRVVWHSSVQPMIIEWLQDIISTYSLVGSVTNTDSTITCEINQLDINSTSYPVVLLRGRLLYKVRTNGYVHVHIIVDNGHSTLHDNDLGTYDIADISDSVSIYKHVAQFLEDLIALNNPQ